jgi:hypothetical protein
VRPKRAIAPAPVDSETEIPRRRHYTSPYRHDEDIGDLVRRPIARAANPSMIRFATSGVAP